MNHGACKSRATLLLLVLYLAACASSGADQAGGTEPSGAAPPTSTDPVTVPPDPSDEVAYKVWSAEVFGSEGEVEKAAAEYLAAALLSDDPEIARRATEVAISAHSWQAAAMAADRWVVLAPDDLDARETATRTLLVGGDYVRAEIQLVETLRLLEDEPWGGWPRVSGLLTAGRDLNRTEQMVAHLIEETDAGENPYARYTLSQVIARSGRFDEAYAMAREAVAAAPREAQLQSWAGRLALSRRDETAAVSHYRAAWQSNPSDRALALLYAELLRQTGAPAEANEVLRALPDTPENRFARVAFAIESGDRQLAMDLYEGFAEATYGDATNTAFQAARSAEVLDLKQQAIDWYVRLEGSEHEMVALLRRAFLLAEIGRLDEARQELLFARNEGGAAVQMETTLVEAQILVEANQANTALEVLDSAMTQFPGDTRLLYSRALIAVQLDRIDEAEANLRTVLEAEPGNAAALNALGYTLADRTNRLQEAEQLIRAAFEIEPEDPAIIDSMGWIAFRLGRFDEAERFLRQALLRDRNAEIAAHLGEVLWIQGREAEARQVWSEGRRMNPDDRVLLETLDRFGVEL